MRVLVADESATLREGAAQALRAAGHEVLCAEDGLQAWRQSSSRIDAAFISSGLAGLDALQLISLWRQRQVVVGKVVVLVDASGAEALRGWAALTGQTDGGPSLLRRPFSPTLLVDLLGTLQP